MTANRCSCDPCHGDLRQFVGPVNAATRATVLEDDRIQFADDAMRPMAPVLCKWAVMVITRYDGDEDFAAALGRAGELT